jgi:hypothetical protein
MERKGMDAAVFWLVIIGPVLIGLAVGIWYGSSKTLGLWTGFAGAVSLLVAGTLQWQQAIRQSQASEQTAGPLMTTMPEGSGGKGGDAKVGGTGIAIGGSGGQAGKYGIGGAGGSAEVHGNGLAAGGAGGAAGEDGIWRAPAKSGYEIAQRKLGLPVDPYLRQFGRGGAGAGYESKLAIIEQLRAAYFSKYSKNPETVFQNINAVPLDYLNHELIAKNEIWRVRIVDDEYEFFIPQKN